MIEAKTHFLLFQSKERLQPSRQRLLITMPYGIGDAVYIGLSAVDQIVKNDPTAQIDIVCNELQREIFLYDSRINMIITAEKTLFPTPDNFTIQKVLSIDSRASDLAQFLRGREYDAVFPGNVAFRFAHSLGTKVLYPSLQSVISDYLTIRNFDDAPASRQVRSIINRHFGSKLPYPQVGEPIDMFMDPEHLVRAKAEIEQIIAFGDVDRENARVVVIAPDTASGVTRPPTKLLAQALVPVLEEDPNCIVYMIASFTDTKATPRLYSALSPKFGRRVQQMSSQPSSSLLYIAALVDQSDMLVTGDTGIMHLAAANKVTVGQAGLFDNKTKIIAIFGGTNPGLYGYHIRTTIVGRGKKEQQSLRPGFLKEGYDPRGRDYFSHVTPQVLTRAVQEA